MNLGNKIYFPGPAIYILNQQPKFTYPLSTLFYYKKLDHESRPKIA